MSRSALRPRVVSSEPPPGSAPQESLLFELCQNLPPPHTHVHQLNLVDTAQPAHPKGLSFQVKAVQVSTPIKPQRIGPWRSEEIRTSTPYSIQATTEPTFIRVDVSDGEPLGL